jgi:PBSX family phage portal protein
MAEPVKVTAEILKAPQAGEGRSKQLDLGQWAYDEHKCAPPIVDPVVLAQLYSRNVAHKACVDAKTANCVGLGWEFKPKPGADPDKVDEYAALLEDFLNLCARRDQKTFTELLTAARKDEEAVGWAAIEITRSGRGQVDGLFHVHAYTLRRRKDRDGWVQKVNGQYRYFRDYGRAAKDTADPEAFKDANEILVLGEDSPDSPFYPLPDHVPALGDLLGDESAQLYQVQFFKNNAVPRIAICVEGGQLDEETKSYVLTYLREGIRGEAHQALLLQTQPGAGDVRIKIEKLTVGTREEADFMAYRKWCRDTVIMAHRVSPSKVTIVEDANRSNSVDQDKTFKEQVIKPDQERYEARIQWLLEDEFGADLPVEFHFKEMDLEDEERIARTRAVYMPAMTNDEVRDLYGMGPAGVDPESGKVVDAAMEEWGRAPFEQQTPPATAAPNVAEMATPALKRLAPQHREFAHQVARLGYLIERIEETLTPGDDPYADPALSART